MQTIIDMDLETRDLLALHLVPGLGPRLTKAMLDHFGTAARILSATSDDLRNIRHIGDKTAHDFAAAMRNVNLEAELELIAKHEVRLLRLGNDGYPQPLMTIPDPSQILYLRGEWLECDRNAVAIVGSRHCTNYGRRVAEKLAGDLARRGFTIVSGLARGIDGQVHRGALAAGGRTIAVLAGGLSSIYPPEHADLAEEVVNAGALISETPMTSPPMSGMFPARNRLISGLGRGTVVIEAADKSGALITAVHASEQGREVFAVPGPIDSPASRGTLGLLKKGAVLVRNVDDILNELGEPIVDRRATVPAARTAPPVAAALAGNQRTLYDAINNEPIHGDALVERTGLPVFEIGNVLLMLEMQGLIRRLPGNRYERK